MNPVRRLRELGQSPWLDYIQRGMLLDGTFARMMDEDGICGVTSNPTILAKAIAHEEYAGIVRRLKSRSRNTLELYEALVLEDIRLAADLLLPVYQASRQLDGYVSLEVSPELAWDTEATVNEAHRLWMAIDRPNSMIKVPATRPGLEAIRRLTALGLNINATLIFSPERYAEVAQAWREGLWEREQQGLSIEGIASVASFFVSRIETLADELLASADARDPLASRLTGRVAVAAAKIAYQRYREFAGREEWQELPNRGCHPQRLLWASTSTKNPAYSDVKYVDELVGPDTVNTLPPQTLAAYRDHGDPAPRLGQGIDAARRVLQDFESLGFDYELMAEKLELEGVDKFRLSWQQLMEALERA